MTPQQLTDIRALKQMCGALLETVQTLGSVPSGELYAVAMSAGIDLATYERLIQILIDAGRVRRSNHLLTYVPMHSEVTS